MTHLVRQATDGALWAVDALAWLGGAAGTAATVWLALVGLTVATGSVRRRLHVWRTSRRLHRQAG